MKVQQLFLRKVRSIRSLDLDFRNPVTGKPMSRIVLAGANGSGKTTILDCIFSLLSAAGKYGTGEAGRFSILPEIHDALSRDSQLQIFLELRDEGRSDLPGSPHIPDVLLSVVYGERGAIATDPLIAEEAVVGGQILSVGEKPKRVPPPLETARIFRFLAQSIQAASTREAAPWGSVVYFPHDRYLASVPQGELGYEPRVYQWAYRYEPSTQWKGSTESYLFSLNYLDLEDRDRRIPANRFDQAVALVNPILDGKRIARVERGRVVVELTEGFGEFPSEEHGLDGLSSGEKQLVLLLTEINRRVVPGSVILIDEPEISLHPTWQRGLVAALDRIVEQYDAQVIMATHSPEILRMAFPEERVVLTDLDMPRGEWKPELEIAA